MPALGLGGRSVRQQGCGESDQVPLVAGDARQPLAAGRPQA